MCDPVTAVTAIAAVAGGVQASRQAKKADKRSKEANAIAQENSEKALVQQEREINRKNAKKPNVAALLNTNRNATSNQTLLAGPQGVDPGSLQLGQNTLLGQ